MAGDTAWKGVLIALDVVFDVKKRPNSRVSIEDYKAAVAKRNKQILSRVDSGYQILHLYMGYDGVLSYSVCKTGLDMANFIIEWCEKNAKATA